MTSLYKLLLLAAVAAFTNASCIFFYRHTSGILSFSDMAIIDFDQCSTDFECDCDEPCDLNENGDLNPFYARCT